MSYVSGNPVMFFDPYGLEVTWRGLGSGWLTGAIPTAVGGGAALGPAGALAGGLIGGSVGMLRYVIMDHIGVAPGQLIDKHEALMQDAKERGMLDPPEGYKSPCHEP